VKKGRSHEISRILWKFVLPVSLIGTVWLVAFSCAVKGLAARPKGMSSPDLATILSSTATLALFVFSIFIAIALVVGWRIVEAKIREVVEAKTDQRLEKSENESRGRAFAILGYVIGENSVTPDFSAPLDEERLREAIFYCEQGYRFLKNTGLAAEFMALNNLLGYSCVLGDKSRRGHLLAEARRLRAAAEEHDAPNLLLTYARTILEFSLEPKELNDACSIVNDVRLNPRLNAKQKREADDLASLCQQRAGEQPGRNVP